MAETIISWTQKTWNPVTGCSKVSEGCKFCYAERLTERFAESWGVMYKPWTEQNAADNIICHPDRLRQPYGYGAKPTRVFVNSMSDLFHPLVPASFITQVFEVMNGLPQHTFQVLTKRPENAAAWPGPWTDNIWMGTSVENARVAHRIGNLRRCPARVRFISFEPLLGPVRDVSLDGIHWAIVGGESGPHLKEAQWEKRWMDHAWAREIRDLCLSHNPPIAFFFKQSSGVVTETGTALLHEDGSRWKWEQYPGQMTPPWPAHGRRPALPAQPEPVSQPALFALT